MFLSLSPDNVCHSLICSLTPQYAPYFQSHSIKCYGEISALLLSLLISIFILYKACPYHHSKDRSASTYFEFCYILETPVLSELRNLRAIKAATDLEENINPNGIHNMDQGQQKYSYQTDLKIICLVNKAQG